MSLRALIRLFAHHRNASHLLMAILVIAGLFALARLNTQLFPSFGIDIVSVSVVWPGASAEDVESKIVTAIEREVRHLDAVKHTVSFAVEGAALVIVEFEAGTAMDTALSNVESAVSRVSTLPDDSERPVSRRIVRYDGITRIVLSGAIPEAALKALAKRIRDDLIARGIDQVRFYGKRDDEIWIEVAPPTLRRLDLSLGDIARRVAESSQDLPSGTTAGQVEKQIRSLGLARDAGAIGHIEVRASESGEKIYLRDVARISDAFDEKGAVGLRRGRRAIELHVQRTPSADALTLARTVRTYLASAIPALPPGVSAEQYDIEANFIRDRINLLLRNGASGLILVLAVLFTFLNGRLAFWVAVGIPVALLATIMAMLATGQSINMLSLFALIMVLGIVVDDAIVVGEHAATLRSRGLAPIEAAEGGAQRMLAPVMAASLTTIAAFLPILLISDIIGQIITAIPFVVVCVLVASLVECFLILPGHLRQAFHRSAGRPSRFRAWFDGRFAAFRAGPFKNLVEGSVRHRYLTLSGTLAVLILSVGLVVGGRVGLHFFPTPETDTVFANIVFAPGTPRRVTEGMIGEVERALRAVEQQLTDGRGGLVTMSFGKAGASQAEQFRSVKGDHLGGVHVELVPSEQRDVRTHQLIEAWRAEIRPMAGLERISLNPRQAGPPSRELDIRLSGGTVAALKRASLEVRALLARYPGVSDIADDLPYGKREIILSVTPRGRALGFTTESVGRQVRDAFEGRIAKKFARGDEEVTVRVQYPEGSAEASLRELYLRAPSGAEVPLGEVVSSLEQGAFARIRREDGQRQVAMTAEIDEAVTTANDVIEAIIRDGLPEIAQRHGLGYSFSGRAEEQQRSLAEMRLGAAIALAAIYIVLAWVFASYVRPVVVMSIIPFGLVGAILGHLVMGYDLTILSLIALLGLSGILVNDSIILVTTIDQRIATGEPLHEAIVGGSQDRLRAVLVTSLTTIGGLLPLLFETDLQARFMIPMAVTIVFGLMVATVLVLLVVPALLGVQEDIVRFARARWPAAAGATPPD